jgi:hypothetical protein
MSTKIRIQCLEIEIEGDVDPSAVGSALAGLLTVAREDAAATPARVAPPPASSGRRRAAVVRARPDAAPAAPTDAARARRKLRLVGLGEKK